jgi:FOG: FHA domain
MFRVTAEVYTGGDVPPMQSYEQPPPPQYPPYDQQAYQQQQGRPVSGPPGGRTVRLVANDGRTYPLSIGSTVIGRGDQANLRLPDVGISRRHARLDYDGAQVVLTDLGSTNGTMVNGQRVSAVALNPGDMIQLGTTTLTFRVDG